MLRLPTFIVVSFLLLSATDVSTKTYKSCHEAWQDHHKPGEYCLKLPRHLYRKPIYANCIMAPEGCAPWTVILVRQDGSEYFNRTWLEYKRGFGVVGSEYFIGLATLFAMTRYRHHALWIKLVDFENHTSHAYYSRFAINNENHRYSLDVLGEYSGTAGDALSYHKGQKFATKDMPDDYNACTKNIEGGWWFHNCLKCHLFGAYTNSSKVKEGLQWFDDKSKHGKKLKYAHMAIRPLGDTQCITDLRTTVKY